MNHTGLVYLTLAKKLSYTLVDQFNPSFRSDLAEMSLVFCCCLEHYSCGMMMDTPIYSSPSVLCQCSRLGLSVQIANVNGAQQETSIRHLLLKYHSHAT